MSIYLGIKQFYVGLKSLLSTLTLKTFSLSDRMWDLVEKITDNIFLAGLAHTARAGSPV